MESHKSHLDAFLERVRAADDSQKKRWLVVSASVIGVLIISLWVVNFSFMMSGYATQAANDATTPPSFFDTALHGLGTMSGGISHGFRALGSAFATPREDVIKPLQ